MALGNVTVVGGGGERTPFGLELVKMGLARVDDRVSPFLLFLLLLSFSFLCVCISSINHPPTHPPQQGTNSLPVPFVHALHEAQAAAQAAKKG